MENKSTVWGKPAGVLVVGRYNINHGICEKPSLLFIYGPSNIGVTHYITMKKDRQYIKIEVAAYSGGKANERPLYFVRDRKKFQVTKILDRWIGQDHNYFRILADDGQVYTLKWHRYLDIWFILK